MSCRGAEFSARAAEIRAGIKAFIQTAKINHVDVAIETGIPLSRIRTILSAGYMRLDEYLNLIDWVERSKTRRG